MPSAADGEMDDSERIDLHPQHVSCPHCGADLLRVDHAPHFADRLFYCTECPRRAEVSFDDPVYAQTVVESGTERESAIVIHRAEERLRPCECSGRFQADAPRRCTECGQVVLTGELDVDLWPGYCDFDMEQSMPPPEVVERINAFDAGYIRRADLLQR